MLLTREKSMAFSDFQVELLNFNLMQKFHYQSIQLETGSYALYSHKTQFKSASQQASLLPKIKCKVLPLNFGTHCLALALALALILSAVSFTVY